MEQKQYVRPDIKRVVMENLMDPGIHNSVGNGEQLGNEAGFDEEQEEQEQSSVPHASVWN